MATRDSGPAIKVEVTPRFELFYALQALASGTGAQLTEWRREIERRIPARMRTSIASIAPCPLMWPLLADALRDRASVMSYAEMLAALRAIDDATFQRGVLGGVFKVPGSVDGLMSGTMTLKRATSVESRAQERLLSLLGLHPFVRESASVRAFEQIVSKPDAYLNEVVAVIQAFWDSAFSTTWATLEPQMKRSARTMTETIGRGGLASLATERRLPVTQQDGAIVSANGATKVPLASTLGVHLIPSAFNIARMWAAYPDSHKRTRFFIPVLDSSILPVQPTFRAVSSRVAVEQTVEPALIFRALGDTTRYAIASKIARTPMTSVELAHAFEVSKPTISHHVQQLRAAGLLIESPAANGTVLSLNRRALERASSAAARDMFSDDGRDPVIQRTRKANRERE